VTAKDPGASGSPERRGAPTMTRSGSELDGKVCVVTGGGRGIGASIGALFTAQGGRVAILDSDASLGSEQAGRLGEGARAYEADVADEERVAAAAAEVERDFGRVDVLVNNAGISRLGVSLSFSTADWRDSFEVMTTGVFICSREFGGRMRAGGGGAIVNISSINSLTAFPMRLAYSAAKAAVNSMTEVLAVEWAAYGIRVNAVAPGMTETEMFQSAIDEGLIDVPAYIARTPLRRIAQPEEIAEAVLYLASDRSRFVTGQVLTVDGGWTKLGWIPWSGDPEAPGLGS
jgi:meso-butanediol dehydrogenase/(S,S)-butanediol dehydrogenase/diacetyl reductase